MKFSSSDHRYMTRAIELAKESYKKKEVPVGCVIVLDDKIIGEGFNRVIADKDISSHAEINAIKQASKKTNNYRLNNCVMYSTLEPCHMCAKAIIDARIKRLIFATEEPKHGSIVSVDNFFDKSYLNHSTTYESGLLKEESALLLKSFFKERR
ncbi:MAG: nucleoside deaminase [Gammaproteobacteria bacterium]